MGHSIITITTAPAGSGKTYVRCAAFLSQKWLADPNAGCHWSNFPIRMDALGAYALQRYGLDAGQFASRVQVIPSEVVESWRNGSSGPWDFFRDRDLNRGHVAIDEIHNFCSRKHASGIRKKWGEWLGEIRHRGATIELISQAPSKIAKELDAEAEIRLSLVSWSTLRDPFFAVPVSDWLELWGKWTGKYENRVTVIEKRHVDGWWRKQHTESFVLRPEWFAFYDSYSTPHSGGQKADGKEYEFQRRGWVSLVGWFMWRNWFPIAWRVGGFGGLAVFLLAGGPAWAVNKAVAAAGAMASVDLGEKKKVVVKGKADRIDAAKMRPLERSAAASQPGPVVSSQPAADLKILAVLGERVFVAERGWYGVGEVVPQVGPVRAVELSTRSVVIGDRVFRMRGW